MIGVLVHIATMPAFCLSDLRRPWLINLTLVAYCAAMVGSEAWPPILLGKRTGRPPVSYGRNGNSRGSGVSGRSAASSVIVSRSGETSGRCGWVLRRRLAQFL